jgi:glycosyltransferase involved in cell wall biosynthesis
MSSDQSIRPVTFVITELSPGGAEKCLVNLATTIDRRRFSPQVISLKQRPETEKSVLVERLEAGDIPVHFLNMRSAWGVPGAVRRLARILQEQQSTLVQSFLYHANIVSALATRRVGIPHLAGIRVADPRRNRHRLERFFCRGTWRFVGVSQSVSRFARDIVRLPEEKVVTIPNGIDLAEIDRIDPVDLSSLGLKDVSPNGRTMAFVGRLHEQKGLKEFLENSAGVFAKFTELHLLLIGDGEQSVRLQKICREQQLGSRVHFLGWRVDALSILAAADLLVLPSRWEGMPNAVLEAMALSKPVVAFDVDGVRELLGETSVIQLAPANDHVQLCERIERMLQDKQFALRAGQLNRERVKQEFSLEQMVYAYEKLYDQWFAHGSEQQET